MLIFHFSYQFQLLCAREKREEEREVDNDDNGKTETRNFFFSSSPENWLVLFFILFIASSKIDELTVLYLGIDVKAREQFSFIEQTKGK